MQMLEIQSGLVPDGLGCEAIGSRAAAGSVPELLVLELYGTQAPGGNPPRLPGDTPVFGDRSNGEDMDAALIKSLRPGKPSDVKPSEAKLPEARPAELDPSEILAAAV